MYQLQHPILDSQHFWVEITLKQVIVFFTFFCFIAFIIIYLYLFAYR